MHNDTAVKVPRFLRTRTDTLFATNPKYVEYCALTMLVFVTLVLTASVVTAQVKGAYLSSVSNLLSSR